MLLGMTPHRDGDLVTAVVAADGGFGAALVDRLARRGAVALVPTVDDADDARAAFASVGGVTAVVHVCGDDGAVANAPLDAMDAGEWDAGCERVLWRALCTLQAAHTALSGRGGGPVVVVTATAGVSGAPRAVPFVAAIEGVRAMAKSAARQWGEAGIAVNCVSVPLDLLAPDHAGLTSFLPPAAIPHEDPIGDVAAAIEFLTGPGAQGISGATLLVDGGAVMAP
jgi:3-oxoacyl-[acyl-carrier protein] reductase